jgi:hypothetical protein
MKIEKWQEIKNLKIRKYHTIYCKKPINLGINRYKRTRKIKSDVTPLTTVFHQKKAAWRTFLNNYFSKLHGN